MHDSDFDDVDLDADYLRILAADPGPAQPPRWARVVPPPHPSRRALARAGVMWSPEVQRRAEARPWMTLRARRQLEADLATSSRITTGRSTPKPTRAQRRAIGAGPWPRLRRRAEAARRRAAS